MKDHGIRNHHLSPARQRLVRLMQTYNFCRLRRLKVRGGEPILDADVELVHDLKLGGDNGPRPELALDDFTLRDEHRSLFRLLDELGDADVEEIQVRYG